LSFVNLCINGTNFSKNTINKLGNFPLKNLINDWLKTGYVENKIFHKTYTGTPQGGIISPLLANIALHGMEKALNVKYHRNGKTNGWVRYTNASKYVVIRYADDFVRQDGSLSSF
jgi:RNA-directed DNA polymerase